MTPPSVLAAHVQTVDHVIVAVADLETATAAHAALLGRTPSWRGAQPALGTHNTIFRLENTYLELLAAAPGAATPVTELLREALGERPDRPAGLALGVADLDAAVAALRRAGVGIGDPTDGEGTEEGDGGRRRTWRSAPIDPAAIGGVRLLLIQHTSPASLLPAAPAAGEAAGICSGVDHVVLFTSDLPATLRFWNDALGVPERWRREVPDRATLNVGLVVGGITIECVTRLGGGTGGPAAARLWGVAYRVDSCETAVARVRPAGLPADDPRPGLAPATRVATVRSERTPTLLLARVGH